MNCTLSAINAKYAHTNPAIRSLKKAASPDYPSVALKEYTINMPLLDILADLYAKDTLLYGFSCYIWNIEMVLKTACLVKKLNPYAVILLGGPEVSFDAEEFLGENNFIDYIIAGEGEKAFVRFLDYLHGGIELADVPSLYYRKDGAVCHNSKAELADLNSLPFVYDDLPSLSSRVIYYESSRGCPYRCAFCLSSVSDGIRYRDITLVLQDIDQFFAAGAMKVKFVDRTFNADKHRAKQIIRHILQKQGKTGFHFEIAAGLLDEETIALLALAPKERIQIEAGIQSVYPPALAAVHRKESFEDIQKNLAPVIQAGNVHTHVDLIAGLPHESYEEFRHSFDSAFFLRAQNLQLGFLKLLRGSELRKKAAQYGIDYLPFAPYTVLKTSAISFEELYQLQRLEDLLQKLYNSGLLAYTVYYLAQQAGSALTFFEELGRFICARKAEGDIRQSDLISFLYEFASPHTDTVILKDLMRFDLYKTRKALLPPILRNENDEIFTKNFSLRDYQKTLENAKKIQLKEILFLHFTLDIEILEKTGQIHNGPAVWLFDYATGEKKRLKLC
jgi:radical SAM superfamily enzyme YgiQ (UPF0313 family)